MRVLFTFGSTLLPCSLRPLATTMSSTVRQSSDYVQFNQLVAKSKRIIALTGAGISAESGVPTFRGEDALWRKYHATELANPEAFQRDPVLVWQFYEWRRQLVASKQPNKAHKVWIELCSTWE